MIVRTVGSVAEWAHLARAVILAAASGMIRIARPPTANDPRPCRVWAPRSSAAVRREGGRRFRGTSAERRVSGSS